MGWYTVTKTINGREYLYRQRTYREGGKVRTESQYVGPGSESGGSSRYDANSQAASEWKETAGAPEEPEPRKRTRTAQTTTTTSAKRIKTVDLPLETFQLRAELGRTAVSGRALRAEHDRIQKRMLSMGIDVSNVKPVVVAFAGSVGRRKSIFTGKYIVTLPRRGGNRTKFKQEYRKALAHRWYDALDRKAWKKLEMSRDEAIVLMAEVMQRGYNATKDKYHKEFSKNNIIASRMYAKLQTMGWKEHLSGEYRKYERKFEWMEKQAGRAETMDVRVSLLKDFF